MGAWRRKSLVYALLLSILTQILVILYPAAEERTAYADGPSNLLGNPGFEQLALGIPTPWFVRNGWTNTLVGVSQASARTGSVGLSITSNNEMDRTSVWQMIPVDEFATYEFSIWMKSLNMTGAGAGIRIEFYTKDQISSANFVSLTRGPIITKFTGDWQQASFQIQAPETSKFAVFYLMNYGNGTIYADDAAVVQKIAQPIILSSEPNQLFYYPDVTTGVVKAKLYPRGGSHASRTVEMKVANANNGTVVSQAVYSAQEELQLTFDPQSLMIQTPYTVTTVVKDTYLKVLDQSATTIYRWERPRSVPDTGTMIVDGSPFFPVIAYHAYMTDYPDLAKIGINTVVGTLTDSAATVGKVLDEAQANGIKVMYPLYYNGKMRENFAIIEQYVTDYKDHPALLGWMLMDEPSSIKMPVSELADTYRLIRGIDPVHPVYEVEANPEQYANYGRVPDILAIDTYPFPRKPITAVGEETRAAVSATEGVKPVWQILQTFYIPGSTTWPYLPTIGEVRNMAYQSIFAGAKGIGYYSINDPGWRLKDSALWQGLEQFRDELALIGELSRASVIGEARSGGVEWKLWEIGDSLYAAALNDTTEPKTTVVPLPSTGYSAQLLYGGPQSSFSSMDNELYFQLGAYETKVYQISLFPIVAGHASAQAVQGKTMSAHSRWSTGLDDLADALDSIAQQLAVASASTGASVEDAVDAVRDADDLARWVSEQTDVSLGGNKALMTSLLERIRAALETIAASPLQIGMTLQPSSMITGEAALVAIRLYNGLTDPIQDTGITVEFPSPFGMAPTTATVGAVSGGMEANVTPAFIVPASLPEDVYPLLAKASFQYKGVALEARRSEAYDVRHAVAVRLLEPSIEVKREGTYSVDVQLGNRLNRNVTIQLYGTADIGFALQVPSSVTLAAYESKLVQGAVSVSVSVTDGVYKAAIVPQIGGAAYPAVPLDITFNANMLANPGIEKASANGMAPEGWALKSGVWDSRVSHGGLYAIRLDSDPDNVFNVAYTASVNAEAGKPYSLTAWIKNSSTAGAVSLGARFINAAGGTIGYAWKDAPSGTDWLPVDMQVVTPANTAKIALYFKSNEHTNGSAWIDDVYLRSND